MNAMIVAPTSEVVVPQQVAPRVMRRALMKAIKRLDNMDLPRGKAGVAGDLANALEESVLCMDVKDYAGAAVALNEAKGHATRLGAVDLVSEALALKVAA